MSGLLFALRHLVGDLLSALVFAGLYAATGQLLLAVAVSIAVGIVQIGAELLLRRPVQLMQWLSLGLVVVLGGTAIVLDDPRFAMLKPTIAYLAVGAVMLKPGWMLRYLPPKALNEAADIGLVFGYLWAALMFVTAIGNLLAIRWGGVAGWATYVAVFPLCSKILLFAVQFLVMRMLISRRRKVLSADSQ